MSLNVELIRSSFEQAKPIADKVADKFYEFLWADYPASAALFEEVDMKRQKKALIGALVYAVDHVDQPDKLVPYLKDMGKRHVPYGTKPEHYEWVGASLLKTFAHFFGEEWTDELNQEWTAVYSFIAETMLEGAAEYVPQLSEVRGKAKEICDSLLKDLLDQEIDEDFELFARAKIRRILFKILEEESEELFKKSA